MVVHLLSSKRRGGVTFMLRRSKRRHQRVSCALFRNFTLKGYNVHSMGVIKVVDIEGNVVCARCIVATNPLTRMRGLLGRGTLPSGEGMLFPHTGSIHMFFMRFAIDAVFL